MRSHCLQQILTGALLCLMSTWLYASDEGAASDDRRMTFLAAEKALNSGNIHQYQHLLQQLDDYPLRPYLEYAYLRKRLHRISQQQVSEFLDRNHDTPLHSRLLNAWLKTLAQQGRWQAFLAAYEPSSNTSLQCYYRWAQHQRGNPQQAFAGLEALWVVGQSQPRACDQLFTAWKAGGHLTSDHVWQRLQLVMQARKSKLARYLVGLLPKQEQAWAELWLRVHRKPELVLQEKHFSRYHPMRNAILLHGVSRLAYRDIEQAVKAWDIIRHRYTFTDSDIATIERRIAMRYATLGHPQALSWLASINGLHPDTNTIEWQIRSAIDIQNWESTLQSIELLDPKSKNSERWRYWQARALAGLEQHQAAEEIYWELADQRSYYGFLAADHLDVGYQFSNQPATVVYDDLKMLERQPGLMRARELYALERILDARREWWHATHNMPEQTLQQAAAIAHQWGWHDRAILTMARTHYRDDLALRFPLVYEDQIRKEANKNKIEPALAFALIRQESAFTPDARSHAGAMGLMQLMPGTAKQAAKNLGIRLRHNLALTDTELNLKLGMYHLHKVLLQNQNNPVLATAAYNAGGHRVKQWMPKQGIMAADIWAETVPFKETRNYIQNIMLFAAIYEQRLGEESTPLAQRMPPIASPDSLLASNSDSPVL